MKLYVYALDDRASTFLVMPKDTAALEACIAKYRQPGYALMQLQDTPIQQPEQAITVIAIAPHPLNAAEIADCWKTVYEEMPRLQVGGRIVWSYV